jgi:CRP/FNR family transcriptional regulator, dissimilatory nitrate respiration regulator
MSQALPDALLVALGPVHKRVLLGAGDTLFRQGDRATHLFFVETGQLKMSRPLSAGSIVTLHVARAGELFAEGALF